MTAVGKRTAIARAIGAVRAGAFLLTGVVLMASACNATGAQTSSHRLERIQRSPQWRDGRFQNTLPETQGSIIEILWKWMTSGDDNAEASGYPAIVRRCGEDFEVGPA